MKIRATAVGFLLSLCLGSVAAAQDRSACEVLMIHALREPGGTDQALAQLRQLREAPFTPYTTFRLLRRPRVQLTVGTPQSLELPTGRTLRLAFLGRFGPTSDRLRFQVSITRPRRADYLPAVQYETQRGEPFFQAGQSYQQGVLVLAFLCR